MPAGIMPQRTLVAAFSIIAVLAPMSSRAGPPFVTDDPVPVGLGSWEINNALAGTLLRGGGVAGLPSIDVNYGIYSGVQLHLQPQLAVVWGPGGTAAGIGDTQIGAKIKFLDDDPHGWRPMVSLYPIVTAPTGSAPRGLGTGSVHAFLPVWAAKSFGKWSVDGGAGYSPSAGRNGRDAWFVGGLVQYQCTRALQLGGEIFEQTAQRSGGRSAPGFNLGGSYDLSRLYHLLFSAGRGLANVSATNRLAGYLALQVTF